ncbi:MAG: DUF421 domain-containing protein [Clostridia bacterium]|nr:DUF421 domain-containing protein [Clostridia bacterium]
MVSIVIRTVIVYFFTALFLRLTGKRQIGEMQVSELVTTILVSELAAIPIADPAVPLSYGVIPSLVLLLFEVMTSFVTSRSAPVKKLLDGTPSLVVRHGEIDQKELARLRIGAEELIAELRAKDVKSLSDVAFAVLETNGKLSVLTEEKQGGQPGDGTSKAEHPVVIDGRVIGYAARAAGMSEEGIKARAGNIGDVFLMTCTEDGTVRIIKRETEKDMQKNTNKKGERKKR